jgi:hypothetical protein
MGTQTVVVVADIIREVQSWDEAVSVGIDLVAYGSDADWHLGELANRVAALQPTSDNMEGKTKTLAAFAREIRQSYAVVKNASITARHVTEEMRSECECLSFGHWREIVRKGVRGGDINHWAELAELEGWSVSRLRMKLREETGGKQEKSIVDAIRKVRALMEKLREDDLRTAKREDSGCYDELMESVKAFLSRCTHC